MLVRGGNKDSSFFIRLFVINLKLTCCCCCCLAIERLLGGVEGSSAPARIFVFFVSFKIPFRESEQDRTGTKEGMPASDRESKKKGGDPVSLLLGAPRFFFFFCLQRWHPFFPLRQRCNHLASLRRKRLTDYGNCRNSALPWARSDQIRGGGREVGGCSGRGGDCWATSLPRHLQKRSTSGTRPFLARGLSASGVLASASNRARAIERGRISSFVVGENDGSARQRVRGRTTRELSLSLRS